MWRGLGMGALIGFGFGVLARILMRVVALDDAGEPAFHLVDSAFIALLFALPAALAGLAAAAGWRRLVRWPLVGLPLFLVVAQGLAIGLGEVGFAHDRGISSLRMAVVLVLFAAIIGLAFVGPWVGARLGRSQASMGRGELPG